jgi:ATP/ADP translocase
MQAITVTGWVAVACVAAMVAVVAGMALFAVYSWARAPRHRYAPVAGSHKQGDV